MRRCYTLRDLWRLAADLAGPVVGPVLGEFGGRPRGATDGVADLVAPVLRSVPEDGDVQRAAVVGGREESPAVRVDADPGPVGADPAPLPGVREGGGPARPAGPLYVRVVRGGRATYRPARDADPGPRYTRAGAGRRTRYALTGG
jgi:hypothetical protein